MGGVRHAQGASSPSPRPTASRRPTQQADAARPIFRIYSMTKPLTSTAIMSSTKKAVQLDDPISKFVPAFKTRASTPAAAAADRQRPASANHLRDRCHTSGLTYASWKAIRRRAHRAKDGVDFDGRDQSQAVVEKLATFPLIASRARRGNYSVATDVLAISSRYLGPAVREISSRSDQAARHDRHELLCPAEKHERFAATTAPAPAANSSCSTIPARAATSRRARELGGGGLVSTPRLSALLQVMLNKGELEACACSAARRSSS